MSALANAYVLVAADEAACFLPQSVTVDGVDFEISRTSEPGPIPCSRRYHLLWRDKGWTGDGLVELIPGSGRTSELHIELRPPQGWMSKLFFSPSRLAAPAWDLTDAIRNRIEVSAGRRSRTEVGEAKKARVALVAPQPAALAAASLEFLSRL